MYWYFSYIRDFSMKKYIMVPIRTSYNWGAWTEVMITHNMFSLRNQKLSLSTEKKYPNYLSLVWVYTADSGLSVWICK